MLATLSFAFTHMAERQHGAPAGAAGAGRRHARGRRRGDEQHAARRAARRASRRTIQAEILAHQHRRAALALQVALLVPILAGLLGLFNSFRMMRLPDPAPSAAADMALA